MGLGSDGLMFFFLKRCLSVGCMIRMGIHLIGICRVVLWHRVPVLVELNELVTPFIQMQ